MSVSLTVADEMGRMLVSQSTTHVCVISAEAASPRTTATNIIASSGACLQQETFRVLNVRQ